MNPAPAPFTRSATTPSGFASLLICALLAVSGLVACKESPDAPGIGKAQEPSRDPGALQPKSTPLREGSPQFEALPPKETGVTFLNPVDLDHPMKHLYFSGFSCGGVAIGDIDGDGRPDLVFAGGPVANRLYLQTGDFRFEDVTETAGIQDDGTWGSSASMADVDGDGDLDLYVCNYDAPNQLYLNRSEPGAPALEESAEAFGLAITEASLATTFADYDRDGDLDCFLLTNRFFRAGGLPEKQPVEVVDGKHQLEPWAEKYYQLTWSSPTRFQIGPVARSDRLLRNDGGKFTDVSVKAGLAGPDEGLSATWWDYNNDGWPDIYVGNDFQDPDRLYRNNRDGTFTDVIESAVPHTSWYSMGADAADLNNDGLVDFLTADMSATTHFKQKTTMGAMGTFADFLQNARPPQYMRNALYLNSGTGRFMEAAYLAGLADTDWTWAVKLADFDNDARVDAFFTNGMSRSFNDSDRSVPQEMRIGKTEWDLYEDTPPRLEQNLAFRNEGGLKFADVSKAWGLDHTGMSYASAYADLDRDGDLDLVNVNLDGPVAIYRNHSQGGHRLLVKLEGRGANRFGYGARVEIEQADGSRQVRVLNPATGFKSSNEPLLHFGLGDQATISKITVRWPSGGTQTLEEVETDQLLTIVEPEGETSPTTPDGEAVPAIFAKSSAFEGITHEELLFDDFLRQPLLPNKLSQLGPGMAWGDVDGDGDNDLYLCGAAGFHGRLLINGGGGEFKPAPAWCFSLDKRCEELGALFFDADSDGDLDLYVVSGSVERPVGDDSYRDSLYLNDGRAYFTKAVSALPDLADSGGPVAAADFDRDGDLDLFVGGRVVPGAYPVAPQSRLLRNDSQAGGAAKFTEVTDQLAPGLREAGMVTGALWSDADGDGQIDLLVTREWGAVMFWRNTGEAGALEDKTEEAGLADYSGWWNGIAGRDLDGDGDIDYVVTNFGLNTKYHANKKKPALLYYGDFEGKGTKCLVEAEFEEDVLFPIRGKSCSTHAMPGLAEKFETYKSFAAASLQDIYTEGLLDQSLKLSATTLESGVLTNDGSGNFTFSPLPHLAQIAPSFGVASSDFDGDGISDLMLAQNFFSPQHETGRMDGGLSLLLRGEGDGTFTPIWPNRSGVVIEGDAKSLTVSDIDGDSRPDFVVGRNQGELVGYRNAGGGKTLRVRLEGTTGNPTAAGARVTLTTSDGETQTSEVHLGGGYLSQSAPELFFGFGEAGGTGAKIEVRWPDGSISEASEIPAEGGTVTIARDPSS